MNFHHFLAGFYMLAVFLNSVSLGISMTRQFTWIAAMQMVLIPVMAAFFLHEIQESAK